MARPKAPAPDTRTRILAAACDEFGAHGFAATTVDRIARRARVNKAMIYYHFPNKRALYTCIIRDVFAPITERVRDGDGRGRAAGAEARPPHRHARALDRRVHALPADLPSRNCRRRRASRPRRARAHRRHLCRRAAGSSPRVPSRRSSSRCIRRWRTSRSSRRSSCFARRRPCARGSRACATSTSPTPIRTRSCGTSRWSPAGCSRPDSKSPRVQESKVEESTKSKSRKSRKLKVES